MEYPTKTIMAVPSVTKATNGLFSVSLLNARRKDCAEKRTVVGILGDADTVPPIINFQVSSCGIALYASSSKLHIPQQPDKAHLLEEMLPNDLPHKNKTALQFPVEKP
ncbi:hypothetical protein PoB_000291000 [Plakobranchus ocellatus]|uniref:Uncharacterized protein n=1 Tax=Plakobranchus ocellatus TaxID=259542 RepID=A0AAV3Y120_9GAST|nr:hypothetical protein PoB_000291000 [Plakobranchus ocellatus]